ncbi:MAG: dihydroxyacetone kinase subunit DhaK [Cephaloticoccus sp.]|nr:dihydroxyacetone kinase subunit DhaK [Cephaloticoccus sp.]
MSHFINRRENMVTEAIDGFLISNGPAKLARLDGYQHTKVLLRQDWDKSRVALISGGGSGHEPSHVGFIGEGMLTAVVCGEIFASPSVDAVLSAICAVTGKPGCLLIVKNYTGDRLNFGLAAERARQMGHKVELVFVADDIAIAAAPHPRGVAGTLFVHKVAGHVAARGGSLAEVLAAAADTSRAVASLGMALSTCTLPGEAPNLRIKEGQAELGLGIHGEPGARVIAVESACSLVATMVAELQRHIPANEKLAVLVNNFGGSTPLEMNVIVKELVASALGAQIELLVGPGGLMTALDMRGFSLSVLPLNPARHEALCSAVQVNAWPGAKSVSPVRLVPMPDITTNSYCGSVEPKVEAMIKAICGAMVQNEAAFNTLDRQIGDGDTGTTFATASRHVLTAMADNELPLAEMDQLCLALGDLLGKAMGGSSGVLLSIFFTAAGVELGLGAPLPAALGKGLERMQSYGGAKPGDRTMIDALAPAIIALTNNGLAAAAAAAVRGAELTATMAKAGAGRSSYVNAANLSGVQDPGAAAVAAAFAAAASI